MAAHSKLKVALASCFLAIVSVPAVAQQQTTKPAPGNNLPSVLYGAAYYNEIEDVVATNIYHAWQNNYAGRWPAIMRNRYGSGTLTYEGTALTQKLQDAVVLNELHLCGLTSSDQQLPPALHVKHGINDEGKRLHYYLNYSSAPATFTYAYGEAHDLLTGHIVTYGGQVTVGPRTWSSLKKTQAPGVQMEDLFAAR